MKKIHKILIGTGGTIALTLIVSVIAFNPSLLKASVLSASNQDSNLVTETDAEDVEAPEDKEDAEDVESPEDKEDAEDVESPEDKEDAEDVESPEDKEDAEDVESPEDKEDAEDVEESDVAPSTTTNTSSSTNIPKAGFEDEVLTVFESTPFSDTDVQTLEGKASAELYRRGVIGGFADGEFKGQRPVNRAEAAKFLLLSKEANIQSTKNNGRFWDVLEDQWYTPFVITAAETGIINGYDDGSFKPANTVNTAEFLKMLTNTFGLAKNTSYTYTDVPTDVWFAQYAGTAEKYNLFPERVGNLLPAQELTRNEVATAIYQFLANR